MDMLLLFSDNLDDDEKWSLKAWEDLLLKVRHIKLSK